MANSDPFEHIRIERDGGIRRLILDRPPLNILNVGMLREMEEALGLIEGDPDATVLLVTGEGRAFCAGVDVADHTADKVHDMIRVFHGALSRMAALELPVIAAVNGVTAGAGFSLALCCDMRVGSENASFVTVFSERNLPPEGGMSYLLPRVVGMGRAMDLILTSRRVDAQEAYRMGLLDRLVAPKDLLSAARDIAARMCELPPAAVRITKRSVRRAMDADFGASTEYETQGGRFTAQTPKDGVESRLSFREKRKPVYTGR